MHEHAAAASVDDPESQARGEALAAWLEGLGLAEHLGEAGLPTFERDAAGVVRWRDPATGQPMSAEQLAALDHLLHAEGEDPQHAVPLALVQLRRQAQVRAALLTQPCLDYAGLAAIRGASENATRFAVHKAAQRGGLLLVPHDGATLIPAFQLTDDGELRPELGPLLEPLLSARMDPWRVWAWLTQPAGLLGGAVPHEAVRDPEEAPLVRHAAVRLAERVTAEA
ncbi:hypothetical protein JK386_08880 [Nocardioides sp. zg-536]|uniref:Uncharacterized protein n=1 Tax=Nocardioides faecalis TaxID=2803858 RepID=A0A939BVJ3_9ACTN|nr:hypothetical protein [Nocardioides faecalis]MBM9460016.1 hypothetical protein [Nocardioides faecalis]MBS4753116.1 hypothetical protein [Nocardioides faecalis]QVI58763.1 hypothetical protein KG111_17715 [Nocardioides faecalis]